MSEASIKNVEDFWDNRPCNIRHSNLEIGTKEYFDEVSAKKFRVEPHILEFSSFADWRDKQVLEIGCGIGTAAMEFVRHGATYTGVELSSESLELCKKRFEVNGASGVFYHGNAERLEEFLPQMKYDLVYSFGVIHHSVNPKKILSQVAKYMTNESVLKVMVYADNSYKRMMIDAGIDRPEAQNGCPIANTYTLEGVQKLFEDFQINSINQDHIFPYQIEPYYRGEYVKTPWFDAMPENIFRALEKSLGWHYLIDAKLK